MATEAFDIDKMQRLEHNRSLVRKVFLEAYKAFTTIKDEDLESVIERLLKKPHGKVYNPEQKSLIRKKKIDEQNVNVLYMLLTLDNVCDLQGCDINYCLKKMKDYYFSFYRESGDLLENTAVICSEQKEYLINIINVIEQKTKQSQTLLREEIIADLSTFEAKSISQENIYVLFSRILKVICKLIMYKIWKDPLNDLKLYLKTVKKPFSHDEHEKIMSCTDLKHLQSGMLLRILDLRLNRKEKDSPLYQKFQFIKELRMKLCYDPESYTSERLSHHLFIHVTEILGICSISLPLPHNIFSELFPRLQHSPSINLTNPNCPTASIHPSQQSLSEEQEHSDIPDCSQLTLLTTPDKITSHKGPTQMEVSSPPFQSTHATASLPTSKPTLPTPDESSFTSSELNVLKLFKALGAAGPASYVFSKVFEALCPGGIPNLENPQEFKKTKYFSDAEKKKMLDGTPTSDLDLSMLDKLMKKYTNLKFDDVKNSCDTLEYNMWCVKGMRNALMHAKPICTDSDFQCSYVNLKGHLGRILDLLQPYKSIQIHEEKDNVRKQLENIEGKLLTSENLQEQREKMISMKKEWAQENVAKTHKELLENYAKAELNVVSPIPTQGRCSEIWDVKNLYTDPEIQMNDDSGNASKDSLTIQHILTSIRSQIRCIVLQGPAGFGKSTFCRYLVQCWLERHTINGLNRIDLLILIQCRDVCKDSKSLITYLKEDIMPKTLKYLSQDEIILCLRESRILYLIDGFDEAGSAAQSLIRDLLKKFPDSTVIITTRPECTPDVVDLFRSTTDTSNYILLNMLGFNDESRKTYVQKLFQGIFKLDPEPFLEYLKAMGTSLGSFTKSPIALAFLASLWKDDKETLTSSLTATKLYQEISKLYIKRDIKRQVTDQIFNRRDIERKIQKWTKALGKVAWKAIKKKRSYIDVKEEDELRGVAEELGLKPGDALSILMKCEVNTINFGNNETWEFIHKSIQEYLSAQHLCINVLPEKGIDAAFEFQTEKSQKESKVKEYIQIIKFVAGILSQDEDCTEKQANEILQLLSFQAPWTFDEIRSLVGECEPTSVFTTITRKLFAGSFLLKYLEGYDLKSLNFIINQTSIQIPSVVKIKIKNPDWQSFRELLHTLVSKKCKPKIIVPVTDAKFITHINDSLKTLEPSDVTIVFFVPFSDHFPYLLDSWSWTSPLHLKFPKTAFPLLWFHLISYMIAKSVQISSVTYAGDAISQTTVKAGIQLFSGSINLGEEIADCDDELILVK